MEYKDVIKSTEKAMGKAIDHLKQEYSSVRTGRASTGLVENIQAEAYGMKQPLRNLASISLADSTSILIKPFDGSQLQAIAKAIREANIGINPVDDGKVIRLAVPPMTEETRKKIASQLKDMAESCKVTLRNARQDSNKQADASLKEKILTEDQHRELKEEIQGIINGKNKQIDEILKDKTVEVMSI